MLVRSIKGPTGNLGKPLGFRPALGASNRSILHSRGLESRNCIVKSYFIIEDMVTSSIQLTEALKVTEAPVVGNIAELDSATAGSVALILKPLFSIYSLLMIVRIVMTWYPEIDGKEFPWSIAYNSTGTVVVFYTWSRQSMRLLIQLLIKSISFIAEFVLAGTRKIVKPFNGLDVSPIVWVALLSFLNEILTGPQGILSMIERKGI